MKELKRLLDDLEKKTKGNRDTIKMIKKNGTIVPFSVESGLLAFYLSIGDITFDQYTKVIEEYRNRNKYLYLFEMAPRTYGQTWGEEHILSIFPEFIKATKQNISSVYSAFDGEFDLWLDGIRVEVKACRANSSKNGGSLASRAYLHSEAKKAGFKYHYQQLKPSCCDVFIWIGTCRDELIYWVLTSEELQKTGKLGPQHRNEKTGVTGVNVFEGQVFMTEEELEPFRVDEKDILELVRRKGRKSK